MSVVNITAETGDGLIVNNGNSFSSVRNASSGVTAQSNLTQSTERAVQAVNTGSDPLYDITRSYFAFNLTPYRGNVNSATFKVYITSKTATNSDTQALHIVASDFVDTSELATSDFGNLTFSSLGSIAWSSITTNAYNEITVNTSGITLGQFNKFALILGRDLNSSVPPNNTGNKINLIYSDNGSNEPLLELDFSPSGGKAFIL